MAENSDRTRDASRAWVYAMGVTIAGTGVSCALLLWMAAVDTGLWVLVSAGVGSVASGAAWFALGLRGVHAYRAYLLTALAPLLAVVTFGLMLGRVPSIVAWQVSRDALVEVAATCPVSASDRWIGVYHMESISKHEPGGGCTFRTRTGYAAAVGFAFLPDGTPSGAGGTEYTPIEGDWYRFVQPFD